MFKLLLVLIFSVFCLTQASAINGNQSSSTITDNQLIVKDFLNNLPSKPESYPINLETSEHQIWYLPNQWCKTLIDQPKDGPIEDCIVKSISNQKVAVVIVVTACEPEHCDVQYWILSGSLGLRKVPFELEGELVVTPDNQSILMGYTGFDADGFFASLLRINLKDFESEYVAACAAPVLSPSKFWIVCRDETGDVYRLSVSGGELELIHRVNLGDDFIYSDAHLAVPLQAVEFIITDNKQYLIRIVTQTRDYQEVIEEIKWVE
ncbi:MAG: hypothetical protein HRU38_07125 [Saccharospirillaceae bacterium]|nr:hypothetical protein [Pseudomonadales bacterium]NRB78427.1 hypothetical protein [Saccharospirillaceae bacterium]